VPPIEEVDLERGASCSSDALSKPLLEPRDGLRTPIEDEELTETGLETQEDARERFVTTLLINLSATMERFDEQILPAVYRFVGDSFQVSCCLFHGIILSQGHLADCCCRLLAEALSLFPGQP
jgi:hypothetical protein